MSAEPWRAASRMARQAGWLLHTGKAFGAAALVGGTSLGVDASAAALVMRPASPNRGRCRALRRRRRALTQRLPCAKRSFFSSLASLLHLKTKVAKWIPWMSMPCKMPSDRPDARSGRRASHRFRTRCRTRPPRRPSPRPPTSPPGSRPARMPATASLQACDRREALRLGASDSEHGVWISGGRSQYFYVAPPVEVLQHRAAAGQDLMRSLWAPAAARHVTLQLRGAQESPWHTAVQQLSGRSRLLGVRPKGQANIANGVVFNSVVQLGCSAASPCLAARAGNATFAAE